MKRFSELGIVPTNVGMIGDKIKISKVLNKEIAILDFKIADSKHTEHCLHLQIELAGVKHVIFTGSKVLINMISQVKKEVLPLATIIVQEGDHFEFR